MDKIHYGILGCGLFGEKMLIPAFENCKFSQLIGLTKRESTAAEILAKQHNIRYNYGSSGRADFLENSEIEAVFVASPNFLHIQDSIDVLEAGKHLLLEKPMAMNAEECKQIIRAAEESGKKIMVAHCLRFLPVVRHFKSVIESEKIGDIFTGYANFFSNGYKSLRTWKFDKQVAGGGAAFDLGVHMIDTLRYIVGKKVASSTCETTPKNRPENEVEVTANFTLRFDTGFIGHAAASYIGNRHTYLEIQGTEGFIRAYDWTINEKTVRVEQEFGSEYQTLEIQNDNCYTSEIDAFSKSILDNTPTPITGSEGLKNQQIIDLVNT